VMSAQPRYSSLPVSVVVPAYNRAAIIGRALASVAAQTCPPAEVLVVDDASTDDTAGIARRWGARVLRLERNGGAAAARNAGMAAATQAWVALLDSDDEWLPHCLEVLWSLRDGHVLVSGAQLGIGDTSSVAHRYGGVVARDPWVLRSPAPLIYPSNFIANSASLVCRDLVVSLGGYDSRLRYSEDFDLWLRLLEHGTGVASGRVVGLYHHHPGQKTKDLFEMLDSQQRIAWSYAGRPWWSRELAESRMVVRRWDEIRLGSAGGSPRSQLRRAAWIAARPHRIRALLGILCWRYLVRRRSWRLDRDGGPSVAIFPGAPHGLSARQHAAPRWVRDLSALSRGQAALELLRHPAGITFVARPWDAVLVRVLCNRPMLVSARSRRRPRPHRWTVARDGVTHGVAEAAASRAQRTRQGP
jgi:glycosyltransferase involved in cell wall biosynthesis